MKRNRFLMGIESRLHLFFLDQTSLDPYKTFIFLANLIYLYVFFLYILNKIHISYLILETIYFISNKLYYLILLILLQNWIVSIYRIIFCFLSFLQLLIKYARIQNQEFYTICKGDKQTVNIPLSSLCLDR